MKKKKQKIKRLLYITGVFLIFGIGFWWWNASIKPVGTDRNMYQDFTIEKGTSLRQIAEKLKDEGLIRDPYAFLLVTKLLGIDGSVQAGEFELSSSMDTFTIARKLTKSITDTRVTFPEGKRAEEVAEILSSHLSTFSVDEITPLLTQYEGYLFPDTYNFEKDASIDDVIKNMKDNFEKKYAMISNTTTYTKDEIVIVASLIEREARHDEDRVLIASVIYNRLGIGMKLDIDASVQYALGYDSMQRTWWRKGLTANDLSIDSPYNTYTNPGLPPSPISNPGYAALQAAANPADTNYFYYLTDRNGINHYARTLAEHNDNIKQFGVSL